LELAEITMDLEEKTGVTLAWPGQVRTVADLQQVVADSVVDALTMSEDQTRQRWESAVCAGLGIHRDALDTPIVAGVPDLRDRLPQIATAFWWDLPGQMRRPRLVVAILWAITPTATLALFVANPQDGTVAIVGLIFGPMVAALGAYMTNHWRPRPPDIGQTTPRMLIERAVLRSRPRQPTTAENWFRDGSLRRADLDAVVVATVAERAGRKPEQIAPTDRLVEDLLLG